MDSTPLALSYGVSALPPSPLALEPPTPLWPSAVQCSAPVTQFTAFISGPTRVSQSITGHEAAGCRAFPNPEPSASCMSTEKFMASHKRDHTSPNVAALLLTPTSIYPSIRADKPWSVRPVAQRVSTSCSSLRDASCESAPGQRI